MLLGKVNDTAENAGGGRGRGWHVWVNSHSGYELAIPVKIDRYTATDAVVGSRQSSSQQHGRSSNTDVVWVAEQKHWRTYARSGPRRRRLLWLAHVAVSVRSWS